MGGYQPLYIKAFETGLVQSRVEFILPDDAFPTLENAYIWRERIRRRQGLSTLGRLRRVLDDLSLGNSGASTWEFNIYSTLVPPIVPGSTAEIEPGSVVITIDPTTTTGSITGYNNSTNCEVQAPAHGLATGNSISISGVVVVPGSGDNEINGGPYTISVVGVNSFTINKDSTTWGVYQSGGMWTRITGAGQQLFDQGDGTLATDPISATVGTINYITGKVTIENGSVGQPTVIDFNYFPGLPVMGLRLRELNTINIEQTVAFDTKYAYIYNGGWEEFIPGTVWTGQDYHFFWSTNYWVGDSNKKIFWVTNFSGTSGDPIRYTNRAAWIDFAPQIDASANLLNQCLALLPFRGRLLAFNTLEGTNLSASTAYTNRIRWSQIGNPFTTVSSVVTVVDPNAWRDDIRGKGGFLDIPTSEAITAVGFVRDNLVIYCERSTWQLRYTGRTISPFQIEKVNAELGAESAFSAVQFDTSLVGIGDKGVVECDSFKSDRIDIKIPDLVFEFNNANHGTERVHGIRDFQQRLAYWTYRQGPGAGPSNKFPNRRLIYNYENDSWAIFTDSLTALGTFQPSESRRWNTLPSTRWRESNFPWVNYQEGFPAIIGGNQQGFVMYLGSNLQPQATNDPTLSIYNITTPDVVNLTIPDHNLNSGQVIGISEIPAGTPYATSLNDNNYGVIVLDEDTIQIWSYNSDTGLFDTPVVFSEGVYVGGGKVSVRDGFSITSKKFNFLEEGQNIQLGFIDVLFNQTSDSAVTLNVYLDYNDNSPINQVGQNLLPDVIPNTPDTFFNTTVPTSPTNPGGLESSKYWHRAICPARGNFITIEWTLSNAQLAGTEQENDVQIDSQILFIRRAGRQLPVGS